MACPFSPRERTSGKVPGLMCSAFLSNESEILMRGLSHRIPAHTGRENEARNAQTRRHDRPVEASYSGRKPTRGSGPPSDYPIRTLKSKNRTPSDAFSEKKGGTIPIQFIDLDRQNLLNPRVTEFERQNQDSTDLSGCTLERMKDEVGRMRHNRDSPNPSGCTDENAQSLMAFLAEEADAGSGEMRST